jgi:uncharacterized RDD family membrane protein YckC
VPDPVQRPSGLARRLAALGYDALLLLAAFLVLTGLLIGLRGSEIPPHTWWFQGLIVCVCVLFYTWFWTHGGQTLGMRAWRIRVHRDDGEALRWRDALLRFGAAWLSVLPAGWGFWSCLFDPEKRCWHDRVTRTRVSHIAVNEP